MYNKAAESGCKSATLAENVRDTAPKIAKLDNTRLHLTKWQPQSINEKY